MSSDLIETFITRLKEYIERQKEELQRREIAYENSSFLRTNFPFGKANFLNAFTTVDVNEIYRIYKYYNPDTELTLRELEGAIHMCVAGEANPKYKTQSRYQKSVAILNEIVKSFQAHAFNTKDNHTGLIESLRENIEKFEELFLFLRGFSTDIELEELESYKFPYANLSEEEWLAVYTHLVKLQIDSLTKIEEKSKEDKKAMIADTIASKALLVEEKMLDILPKDSADIIRTVPEEEEIVEETTEVEIPEIVVEVETEPLVTMSVINNKEILEYYNSLCNRAKQYKGLGHSITETKKKSFDTLRMGLVTIDDYRQMSVVFDENTYKKFIYYCLNIRLRGAYENINTPYEIEEHVEYEELIMSDLKDCDMLINIIDEIVKKEREEEASLEEQQNEETIKQNPYKLLFYTQGEQFEMTKCLKDFTPEKIQDLVALLRKLEEGRVDRTTVLKKNTDTPFKALIGQYVFVAFRILPKNHILVYLARPLVDLNRNINKLDSYDRSIEDDVITMIRDELVDYRKLSRESNDFRIQLFSQVMTKGV